MHWAIRLSVSMLRLSALLPPLHTSSLTSSPPLHLTSSPLSLSLCVLSFLLFTSELGTFQACSSHRTTLFTSVLSLSVTSCPLLSLSTSNSQAHLSFHASYPVIQHPSLSCHASLLAVGGHTSDIDGSLYISIAASVTSCTHNHTHVSAHIPSLSLLHRLHVPSHTHPFSLSDLLLPVVGVCCS